MGEKFLQPIQCIILSLFSLALPGYEDLSASHFGQYLTVYQRSHFEPSYEEDFEEFGDEEENAAAAQ